MGNVLLKEGKHSEAAACYDTALGIDDRYEAAWVGKARAVKELFGAKAALKYLDEAISLAPGFAEVSELRRAWETR
jgi:tetratricopeptide (TPR) repeat protein